MNSTTCNTPMSLQLPRGLKICTWNCQGLISKLEDVRVLLSIPGKECDVLGITESWLDYHYDSEIDIPGYNILRKDRTSAKHRGGVAAYIMNSLQFTRRHDLEKTSDELLWIELFSNFSPSILLCIGYRPPNTNLDWISRFELGLESAIAESPNLIIMGDFNIDLLTMNSLSKKWLDLFNIHGLTQLIYEPTRVTISTKSIIDHIFVSKTENIKLATVIKCGNSEVHFPTALVYKRINFTKHRHTYITYPSYRSLDEDSFVTDLGNVPWSLLESCDNVDDKLDLEQICAI